MAWAYFDESVVHIQPAGGGRQIPAEMLVGGCLASETKWKRLETAWKKALRSERVDVFHAKDFHSYRREFEWLKPNGQRDTERHDAFDLRLAEIIATHVDEALVFTSQVSIKRNGKVRQVYADGVVRALHRCQRQILRDEAACVIFAHHPELSRWTILRFFERMTWDGSLKGCGVFDPRDVIPLQAADYVCHSANKTWWSEDQSILGKEFGKRGKPFAIQLGSSWKPDDVLNGLVA